MKNKYISYTFLSFFIVFILTESILVLTGFYINSTASKLNTVNDSDKNSFRILTLGESTTADSFQRKFNNSWPRLLEKDLKENNFNVKIYNAAVAGTISPYILKRLNSQIKKYQPNLIIAMMGINDKGSSLIYYKENSILNLLYNLKTIKLFRLLKMRLLSINNQDVQSFSSNLNEKIHKIKTAYLNENPNANKIFKNLYNKTNNTEKEILIKYSLIRIYPKSYVGCEMAECFIPLEKASEFALALSPRSKEAYASYFFAKQSLVKDYECAKKGIYALKNHIELSDVAMARLLVCIERHKGFMQAFSKLMPNFKFKKTKFGHHHRLLYKIAKENKIPVIFMQYPTLDISELKGYFGPITDNSFIHFIENKDNFLSSLENEPYENFFEDRFQYTWGHCTKKGYQLISNNIMKYLMNNSFLSGKLKKYTLGR